MQGWTNLGKANQMPARAIYSFQINQLVMHFIMLVKMECVKGSPFKYRDD